MQRDARNSPQHTAGPWFEDEAGICAADRLVATIALPEEHFGADPDSLPAHVIAELSANARLIAAAPRLLEALEEALEFVEGYEDVVDGDYGVPEPNKAMVLCQTLRAAISRATGEVQS